MDDPRYDDLRSPLVEQTRLRRHNRAVIPLALIVAVAFLGWLGQSHGRPPSPAPTEVALAQTATPQPSPHVGPVLVADDPGIAADPFSSSLAAAGRRIYYTINGQMLLSVGLTPGTAPELVDWVGACRSIDDVAVSGQNLLFVESQRGNPLIDSCSQPTEVDWEVVAYDLSSRQERVLATGSGPINHFDPGVPPVHVAVSETEFAFERTTFTSANDTGRQSTVEVHSLADGSLRWTATLNGPIRNLMLGGSHAAAVASTLALPELYLLSADAPARLVAPETTGGSLSSDGRYLVWDEPGRSPAGHPSLQLLNIDTGDIRDLGAVTAPPGFPSVQPAVAATAGGPVVAWYSTRPDAGISVRFVDPAHPDGAWLDTGAPPSWMSVQDDNLLWLAPPATGGGLLAHAATLRTTPLASSIP